MDLSTLEGLLSPQAVSSGASAVNQAPQGQVDSHRGFLADAFSMLEQQGGNPAQLAQAAQVGTTDPQQMGSEDLVRSTLALARNHPQVVEAIASRYPEAQPLVGAILGNAANAGGQPSGLFGGLLNRFGL